MKVFNPLNPIKSLNGNKEDFFIDSDLITLRSELSALKNKRALLLDKKNKKNPIVMDREFKRLSSLISIKQDELTNLESELEQIRVNSQDDEIDLDDYFGRSFIGRALKNITLTALVPVTCAIDFAQNHPLLSAGVIFSTQLALRAPSSFPPKLRSITEDALSVGACMVITKNPALCAGGTLLTKAVPVESLENGWPILGHDSNAEETIKHLKTSALMSCTGLAVTPRKVLTAAHCVGLDNTVWATDKYGVGQQSEGHIYSPKGDAAVLKFPRPLHSTSVCPITKLMSQEDYAKIKTRYDACGVKGNILLTGTGMRSSNDLIPTMAAKTGLFIANKEGKLKSNPRTDSVLSVSYPSFVGDALPYTDTTSASTVDVRVMGKAKVRPGDSGGPVLGCNPRTQRFELLGVASTSSGESFTFTNLANNNETKSWYEKAVGEPSSGCRQKNKQMAAYELYPSPELNKRNLPRARQCLLLNSIGGSAKRLINRCHLNMDVEMSGARLVHKKHTYPIRANSHKDFDLGRNTRILRASYSNNPNPDPCRCSKEQVYLIDQQRDTSNNTVVQSGIKIGISSMESLKIMHPSNTESHFLSNNGKCHTKSPKLIDGVKVEYSAATFPKGDRSGYVTYDDRKGLLKFTHTGDGIHAEQLEDCDVPKEYSTPCGNENINAGQKQERLEELFED